MAVSAWVAAGLFTVPVFSQSTPGPIADRARGEYDCVIKPSQEVHVSTPTPGVIETVAVDRGSRIGQGEPIATLFSDIERAAVAILARKSQSRAKIESLEARVAFLTRKRDRNKVLNASQYVSTGALDEIQTDLAQAKQSLLDAQVEFDVAVLELARAQAQLAQRTIKSPIAGVVTERKLSAGEYWQEQQWVATIANIEVLHVEAFVPIGLHGRITVGGAATVFPEAPIGGRHRGSVEVVDRVYDAASGTFGVRLRLPNPDLVVPAGIRCRVMFDGIDPEIAAAALVRH